MCVCVYVCVRALAALIEDMRETRDIIFFSHYIPFCDSEVMLKCCAILKKHPCVSSLFTFMDSCTHTLRGLVDFDTGEVGSQS